MGLFEAGLSLLFWPIPIAKMRVPMGDKAPIKPEKSVEVTAPAAVTDHPDELLSRLLCLPVEIFDEIARYLRPAELTSLALTCKDLWALGTKSALVKFRDYEQSWRNERLALLSGLARDSQDHILCANCGILQPVTRQPPAIPHLKPRSRCTCFNSSINICDHFKITRRSLELATKRYIVLGHPDTRLTRLFRHSCKWRTAGRDSAEFTLDLKSRLIDGEMHLKQSYSVDVKMDARGTFHIPSMRGKGCLHTGIWLKKKCACSLRHSSKKEPPCNRCLTVQPCVFCHTHFKVSSELQKDKLFRLCVTAYRCIGAGQAGGRPSWIKWHDQTTIPNPDKSPRLWHPSSRPSLEYVFEMKGRGRFEKQAYPQSHPGGIGGERRSQFYKDFWQSYL